MAKETPSSSYRIAVTRERVGKLGAILEAAGHHVLHCPLLRVELSDDVELRRLLSDRIYDWLAFTSSHAVEAVAEAGGCKPARGVACVGDATAEHARERGFDVTLVPERQHVKGLIEAFAGLGVCSGRVLFPRGDLAPKTLTEGLTALGFVVDDPVVYVNMPDDNGAAEFGRVVRAGGLDAVAFASPSTVKYAAAAVGEALSKLRLFSIGPSTSAAIRDLGFCVAAEATEHNEAGLAAVILEALHG